ncbi:MAG: hypothetical protein AAFU53_13695 [Cyanobacteria bacterium J06632_3]
MTKKLAIVSFLALAAGLLGTACTSSQTSLQPTEVQAAKTIETKDPEHNTFTQETSTDSEVDPADAYVANDYDVSEIDDSDACDRNPCENALPSPLSLDELNTIGLELGPEELIIREQSFALTLPVIGRTDFIATESAEGRLSFHLRSAPNQYEKIYTEPQWKLWKLKAVAFEDIHQDGDGPDIIVIAEYVTGIGPEGALPFTAPAILFNRGDDTFQNDIAVNSVLSEYNAQTVEDVIAAAKADGLVRGLQYYEGP